MKVTTSKSKNAESFYISKSFINDKGVSTSVNVRKLGTLADLLKKHGPTRDDVMEWARAEARLETQKYKEEKKICTLYIERNFRNKKIGSQMIKKSFEYLETNKPLITIPEEEYLNFKPLLEKYNFIETKKIKNYYRKNKIEYFYN